VTFKLSNRKRHQISQEEKHHEVKVAATSYTKFHPHGTANVKSLGRNPLTRRTEFNANRTKNAENARKFALTSLSTVCRSLERFARNSRLISGFSRSRRILSKPD
jgi:hypothetical protein